MFTSLFLACYKEKSIVLPACEYNEKCHVRYVKTKHNIDVFKYKLSINEVENE